MFEMAFVRPVAKWFICRHTATTNGHYGAALQAVLISLHINYFEVAFNFNRAVIIYCKFCFGHDAPFFGEDKQPLRRINGEVQIKNCPG
jgi:hypothetical protein